MTPKPFYAFLFNNSICNVMIRNFDYKFQHRCGYTLIWLLKEQREKEMNYTFCPFSSLKNRKFTPLC